MLEKKKSTKKNKALKAQPKPSMTVIDIEEEIKKQVDKSGEKLPQEEKTKQIEALKRVFIDGKLAGEALGFDANFTNLLYGQAYDRYSYGLYKEANQMFRLLCLLEPNSARFHLGLAATNHRMGNYEIAVPIYYASWFCDKESPVPLVYCSDCYMEMKKPEAAYCVLKMAVDLCGDLPLYEKLKTKCTQIMSGLQGQCEALKEKPAGKIDEKAENKK